MKSLINKFKTIEQTLSRKEGEFNLFALFLRENSPGKWDLLISSDWAMGNKKSALNIIADEIKKMLSTHELLMLSKVIIFDKDNEELKDFQRTVDIEHGEVEFKDENLLGLQIKHAYVITSKLSKNVIDN